MEMHCRQVAVHNLHLAVESLQLLRSPDGYPHRLIVYAAVGEIVCKRNRVVGSLLVCVLPRFGGYDNVVAPDLVVAEPGSHDLVLGLVAVQLYDAQSLSATH